MSELPSQTGAAPLKQSRNRRRLVILVITLGLLLVAGFVFMVGTIIYRISNGDSQRNEAETPADDGAVLATISLLRPAGAELVGATSSDDRLTLHFRGPGGELVLLVDLVSGQVISRIEIAGAERAAAE